MEPATNTKPVVFRYLKLLLKIGVTIACLWYVFSKINLGKSIEALEKANWGWLLAAFLIYTLSKLLASGRLNIYFNNIGFPYPIGNM